MDAISSLCNDIISYMATTPSSHSLSSLDIQAATSGALFSSEAYRSLWATKQNGVSWTTVLDECSEVSEVREVSEVSPLQELDAENHCQRYKTELCRPFEESGFCRYGNRCQFAHGKQELRTVDRHPKYKTQLCKTFHTTGLCRYGKRCHFIHNEDEGADAHRLIPQQQQHQQPMSGLRKLIGRQNVESVEEQRMRACSILPASVPLASSRRYAEGLSSPVSSGMSLPSSAASSPSPSLTSFSDDAFSSSAASEFSQIPNLCKASTSPYSSLFYSTDLFSHPSSIPSSACTDYSPALPPKAIVFSRDDNDDARSQGDDVFDAVLRHLTTAQIQRLLLEYLLEKEKRNPSV